MNRVSFMPYHLCNWYIQNWILQQKEQMWVYVHNVTNFIKKSRSKSQMFKHCSNSYWQCKRGWDNWRFFASRDLTNWGRHTDQWFSVNDQSDAQFFSMYLSLFLTLYMFRAHCAHHQQRQIVSIQTLVTVILKIGE